MEFYQKLIHYFINLMIFLIIKKYILNYFI